MVSLVLFPVLVGSLRSAAPWPLPRHARIQERVKPSGSVQGHRTHRVGKNVGNGRRGGSGSVERIAIRGRRDELGLDGAFPVPRAEACGFFPHSRA